MLCNAIKVSLFNRDTDEILIVLTSSQTLMTSASYSLLPNNNIMEICKQKGYLFISNSEKPTDKDANSIAAEPIGSFAESSFYAAKAMGYKLYKGISRNNPDRISCSDSQYEVIYYDQHIYRNIFNIKDNIIAYKNICTFINEHPDITILHCNTPIGGVIGRIVGRKYKLKVIYTAHGFHFYKGAPFWHWLLFFPIEYLLSRYTDILITINKEDYKRALRFPLRKKGKVCYVPGVGIDTNKFINPIKSATDIRKELRISENAIIVIAVGRLDNNKNNRCIIEAMSHLNNKDVYLIICGEGSQRPKLQKLIDKKRLNDRIKLLGKRTDIVDLYNASDIFIMASKREGLSRSIMEAMSVGLPCIVSNIRAVVIIKKKLTYFH